MTYNISEDAIGNVFDNTVWSISLCCFGETKNKWGLKYLELFEKEFEILKASFKLFIGSLCEHGVLVNGGIVFGWLFEELRQSFGYISDATLLTYVACMISGELLKEIEVGSVI